MQEFEARCSLTFKHPPCMFSKLFPCVHPGINLLLLTYFDSIFLWDQLARQAPKGMSIHSMSFMYPQYFNFKIMIHFIWYFCLTTNNRVNIFTVYPICWAHHCNDRNCKRFSYAYFKWAKYIVRLFTITKFRNPYFVRNYFYQGFVLWHHLDFLALDPTNNRMQCSYCIAEPIQSRHLSLNCVSGRCDKQKKNVKNVQIF